jgi:hypothetical protein
MRLDEVYWKLAVHRSRRCRKGLERMAVGKDNRKLSLKSDMLALGSQ